MEKEKRIRGLADTLLILLITIVTGTILIMACGADPAEAYSLFFRGIFGTPAAFAEIFVKACPLILTGLGCAVAYRTGFFNIGAEGQFLCRSYGDYDRSTELERSSWNPKNHCSPGSRFSGWWCLGTAGCNLQGQIQYFRNHCYDYDELHCH